MAAEGWNPRLELWEEPGTIMHKVTQVVISVLGGPEAMATTTTTFTCFGSEYGTEDARQHLQRMGYPVDQVYPPMLTVLQRPPLPR